MRNNVKKICGFEEIRIILFLFWWLRCEWKEKIFFIEGYYSGFELLNFEIGFIFKKRVF